MEFIRNKFLIFVTTILFFTQFINVYSMWRASQRVATTALRSLPRTAIRSPGRLPSAVPTIPSRVTYFQRFPPFESPMVRTFPRMKPPELIKFPEVKKVPAAPFVKPKIEPLPVVKPKIEPLPEKPLMPTEKPVELPKGEITKPKQRKRKKVEEPKTPMTLTGSWQWGDSREFLKNIRSGFAVTDFKKIVTQIPKISKQIGKPLIEMTAKEVKEIPLAQAQEIRGAKIEFEAKQLTQEMRGKIIGVLQIKPKGAVESKIFMDLPTMGGPNQLRNALKRNIRKLAKDPTLKLKEADVNFSIVGDEEVLTKIFARKPRKALTLQQKLPGEQIKPEEQIKNEIVQKLDIAKEAKKQGNDQAALNIISQAIDRATELTADFIQNERGATKGGIMATMIVASMWNAINDEFEEITEGVTNPVIQKELDNVISSVEDISSVLEQATYAENEEELVSTLDDIGDITREISGASKNLVQTATEIYETETLAKVTTTKAKPEAPTEKTEPTEETKSGEPKIIPTKTEPEAKKAELIEAMTETEPATQALQTYAQKMILAQAASPQTRIIYISSPSAVKPSSAKEPKKETSKKKKKGRRRRKKSKKIRRKKKKTASKGAKKIKKSQK